MYCVYEWDEHRDLVTLTAADGYGLRWTQVMTWEQWETVADQAMEPGFGGPGPMRLEDLRALVASVIGSSGSAEDAAGRGIARPCPPRTPARPRAGGGDEEPLRAERSCCGRRVLPG
jgi:hypothetical protein